MEKDQQCVIFRKESLLPSDIVVVGGHLNNFIQTPSTYIGNVEKITLHKDFNLDTLAYDIAILLVCFFDF